MSNRAKALYTEIQNICDVQPCGYLKSYKASSIAHEWVQLAQAGAVRHYASIHEYVGSALSMEGFRAEAIDLVAGLIYDTFQDIQSVKVAA